MADSRQNRIPVPETIFTENLLHVFRFQNIAQNNTLRFTILGHLLFSADNVVLFILELKPLVDFIFCLGTFYNIQPVPARSPGVLGRNDLNPVTVLDPVINGYQLSVDPGAHHLIADSAMNTVSKINRRRTVRKIFHISGRCKTVNTFRE